MSARNFMRVLFSNLAVSSAEIEAVAELIGAASRVVASSTSFDWRTASDLTVRTAAAALFFATGDASLVCFLGVYFMIITCFVDLLVLVSSVFAASPFMFVDSIS